MLIITFLFSQESELETNKRELEVVYEELEQLRKNSRLLVSMDDGPTDGRTDPFIKRGVRIVLV